MVASPETKDFDVFVSHSSRDKEVAERLAVALSVQGYSVWFDAWELLAGQNIVDAVYKGITASRFMVVLLSKQSVQSQWVISEFTAARSQEIKAREVIILPVMIEACEIPGPLMGMRYVDFTADWDRGLQEILDAIEGLATRQTGTPIQRSPSQITAHAEFGELDKWRSALEAEIASEGLGQGFSYKDALIGPIDATSVSIDRTLLIGVVDASKVRLRGGNGLSFPIDKYTTTDEIRLPNGVRFIDTTFSLHGSEPFHFWQIEQTAKFLHRAPIIEDTIQDGQGERSLKGRLARSWALADIVSPLLFAKNILQQSQLDRLGVKLVWSGLRGRSLTELSSDRFGFFNQYTCGVSEWTFEIAVTRTSDIVQTSRKAALDLFWLFGWEPIATTIDPDLESLSIGIFPS